VHADQFNIHYVKKNKNGAFDLVKADFLTNEGVETVIGTYQHEIIATAFVLDARSPQIVTLNTQREIKSKREKKFRNSL